MPRLDSGPPVWARLGKLYTTDDVAEWLQVDVVTVRRAISRGELTAIRIGGEYRFSEKDLREFLNRQQSSTAASPEPDAEPAVTPEPAVAPPAATGATAPPAASAASEARTGSDLR